MSESNSQGYSDRFSRALRLAHQLHDKQLRKGTSIPYMSHLLAVESLVRQSGGDEDEAIAALLHDGPEDAGGRETLEKIRKEFGDRVADIVAHCTDTFDDPKPEWWPRKRLYHAKLRSASSSALMVSLADKVHNAESTADDLEALGPDLWNRFNKGREGSLWNYASLLEIYRERAPSNAANLLDRLETALDRLFESESEKVMAPFFDPSSRVSNGPPELRIVSGAVCTGKSRFIREQVLQGQDKAGYVHLDAPRIFLGLCRGEFLDFPGELEERMEHLGLSVASRAINERRNIVVEVIGQDSRPLNSMLERLRACDYELKVDVLDCDVEVALQRNEQRGENNISSYYAEPYHLRWLATAATDCLAESDA